MLGSIFALALVALVSGSVYGSPTTFPVELQLPVVTLVSVHGEEKKLEVSVAGELTLEGGKAVLKNVRLHSPSQTEVSLAAPVSREVRSLLMEVSSFEVAVALFQAQVEHFQKKKTERFSDQPFRITQKQFSLWEIPLQFEQAKGSTLSTEVRFLMGDSGTVEKIEVVDQKGRSFDLQRLQPQIESLNPWEALGWLLAGKKARVGTVQIKDGAYSHTLDLSDAGLQKRMKDEADRVLLRDQVSFQTRAQAKAIEDKENEEVAKGCATVAGCGCAIAAAAGGGGLAAAFWVLSWLF